MKEKLKKQMHTSTKLVLGFFLIILVGALILSLPISSKSREFTPFLTALFTSTSATCVTGLVLVDTNTYWSGFGQTIILILIQIGGLGFMTIATLFSLALRRRITFKERLVMSSALNVKSMAGVVRLTRHILLGTLLIEGVGAIILAIRFYKDFGFFGAITKGIFHSISAFCNAGFDLLGGAEKFVSLTNYVHDPIINITIMALIILGGLGFFVWGDIYGRKRLSTHTKLVLISTVFLVVSGSILFYIFEFNNPLTIQNMSNSQKVLASVFQSVTTRTAGFNTISQAGLTDASHTLSYILMFIGGSPGSTAGGVKTVSIAILILSAFSTVRGRTKFNFAGRNINISAILNALSIVIIAGIAILVATFTISLIEPFAFKAILFEVISAIATVGLSFGITPELSIFTQMILILLMFLGRVGILTLGFILFMGKKQNSRITYPEGIILIG